MPLLLILKKVPFVNFYDVNSLSILKLRPTINKLINRPSRTHVITFLWTYRLRQAIHTCRKKLIINYSKSKIFLSPVVVVKYGFLECCYPTRSVWHARQKNPLVAKWFDVVGWKNVCNDLCRPSPLKPLQDTSFPDNLLDKNKLCRTCSATLSTFPR